MTTSKTKKGAIQLIDKEWCKGCGICIHFCPKDVLGFDKQGKAQAKRPEDCIACRLCELRCPDLAIQIIDNLKLENPESLNQGGEDGRQG